VALALAAAPAYATPAHAGGAIAASQPLVELKSAHIARTRPDASARRIESVSARRPLTGVRTALPVIGSTPEGGDDPWVHVRLPGRPTGHTGWIRARELRHTSTAWHVSVDLSERRVRVYHDGRVERRFSAVVGAPSTPTPRGRFFVEEAVALSPLDAGGPYALAASARSRVLQEFGGGPGQIAIHGTGNLVGALGTALSHGCIRLSPSAITWLARRVDAGAPLTITR
jgi:lipoprotein-anchoring transpeptidase ErfK/SrfK